MKCKEVLKKKFFVNLIILLFIALFLFLVINGYLNFATQKKVYISDAKYMIDQRMRSLLFQMSVFPKYMGDDLLFLSRLSSLKGALDSSNNDYTKDVEKDFLEFIKGSASYYQLRYIDENGKEVVRAEYDGESYKSIPKNKLQDKKNRYYFYETMNLSAGEIYLSELDLNIEDGKIENRGTVDDPQYIPTLRIATPVFKKNGSKGGIVLLNIYADYFLEDIRRAQKPGEEVYLINRNGFYLSNPNTSKEFAFMLGKENNFFNDYPEISRERLTGYNTKRIETDRYVFSFNKIHPTIGDIGLVETSKATGEGGSQQEYYWVLVVVSNKDILDKAYDNLESKYINSLLFSGIFISVIITLILIFVFKVSFKSKREIVCE